ncbi:hypothetical protein A3B42_02020 [Candidatus Daviesbacteria bacterium RIFCSPLOWO2_01_FULL_38_10]|uniref:NTP pyrophosphohydrolase including oxidative damage repair enzyme n=1 Tax=Candidatus Daviesbacteria bacterium GW2011_GWF2_38_6 TaxID=1618432 RepID=A0A0G0NLC8_9BACT|nr:MAG: NTP pyrophosphohydrolase including oxidative damage repair enzyme [Candidatus Daviesbacteria bacterium GW2011_GWF2_38_6]OGE27974.1 MAG: hypothetical protein A3D02_04050 [Candidatus Daviesbacteria bacterium RIFCSPHIGHO2_02_FULL_39_41]OGE37490.1 MAG: hypothetical protein A3B42_02020 [Candidatus Daviesbacteria bacterium RIFCSPLOWO2_01_FULL_38_10]OGE68525.1 MAG: hypothetical protein A3H81_02220 [Candidatus Daviesbacteria bacterium RIFCSPLOWO2_02_FULL_38_18]OGE72494.1 MAG: hypothetical prote
MIFSPRAWRRVRREKILHSKFLQVYQDKIELPSGDIIDDYTLVKKPDIVMIVATTRDKKIIFISEYEHGAGKKLLTFPSGHIKKGEDPVDAARRELLEEVGYGKGNFSLLGSLYEYPSKDLHQLVVVRAENVEFSGNTKHEITEDICTKIVPINQIRSLIDQKKLKVSAVLASLTLSGLL